MRQTTFNYIAMNYLYEKTTVRMLIWILLILFIMFLSASIYYLSTGISSVSLRTRGRHQPVHDVNHI